MLAITDAYRDYVDGVVSGAISRGEDPYDALFQHMDQDNNGTVEVQEVWQACQRMQLDFTQQDLDDLFATLNLQDGRDGLNIDDFRVAWELLGGGVLVNQAYEQQEAPSGGEYAQAEQAAPGAADSGDKQRVQQLYDQVRPARGHSTPRSTGSIR